MELEKLAKEEFRNLSGPGVERQYSQLCTKLSEYAFGDSDASGKIYDFPKYGVRIILGYELKGRRESPMNKDLIRPRPMVYSEGTPTLKVDLIYPKGTSFEYLDKVRNLINETLKIREVELPSPEFTEAEMKRRKEESIYLNYLKEARATIKQSEEERKSYEEEQSKLHEKAEEFVEKYNLRGKETIDVIFPDSKKHLVDVSKFKNPFEKKC